MEVYEKYANPFQVVWTRPVLCQGWRQQSWWVWSKQTQCLLAYHWPSGPRMLCLKSKGNTLFGRWNDDFYINKVGFTISGWSIHFNMGTQWPTHFFYGSLRSFISFWWACSQNSILIHIQGNSRTHLTKME